MGVITTSAQAQGLSYPSQSYLDRSMWTSNLVQIVRLTSGELRLYKSSNNGTSWTDTGVGFTRANLQEWSGIYIDADGYLHIAYRVYESGQDRIYYRRSGDENTGWSSEVLVASATSAGAGQVYTGLDLVTVKISSDLYYTHVAVGTTSGANIGVTMFSVKVYWVYDYYGGYWNWQNTNSIIQGTRSWFVAGSGRITPSLDFRHNGDAHNGDVPDLWVAFGRTPVSCAMIAYSGGRWTGSSAATLIGTPSTAMDHNAARFDGTRFLVCVWNNTTVQVHERDISNTLASVVRTSPAHTTGNIRACGISYSPQNGDFRLFAVGTSNQSLYYVDYSRATNTWGAWTLHVSTIVNINNFGVRRGTYGNSRHDTYTQTGSTPFTLSTQHNLLNFAPNTPIWFDPVSGAAQDVAKQLTLTWTFSDPNTTDTQGWYALSRTIGVGTIQYWRASDGTWQATEQQNASSSNFVTLPAGWGLDSDAEHAYSVKTWDATGLASGYSTSLVVIPSTPIVPVITTPAMTSTPVMSDSFTRAGNLSGSTPDVLAVGVTTWTLASGSASVFTTDGTKLISSPATSAAAANINYNAGYNNPSEISFDMKLSTLASTAATRDFTIFMRMTGGNFIGLGITITSAGVPSMFFRKTTSAGTSFPWGSNFSLTGIIPSNTAKGVNYAVKFGVVGQVVYCSINGIIVGTQLLTAAEVASIGGNIQFRTTNTAGTPSLDIEIDNWQLNGLTMTTFTGPTVRPDWVAVGQTAFRLVLTNTTTGTLVTEHDSGWVTSSVNAYTIPVSLSDLQYYNMTLYVRNAEGLVSTAVERTFYVDYTEPTTPTYTVNPYEQNGVIQISISNPKNTGTQPAVINNEIYRRIVGNTTTGVKIISVTASTLPKNLLLFDSQDRESIEQANYGWNSNNGAVQPILRDNAQSLDGSWSFRLAHTAGGSPFPGAFTDPAASVPVTANTSYTLSYWVKAGGTSRALSAIVSARGGSDGSISLGSIAGAPTVTSVSSGWTQFTWTFTTPASTTFLTVSVGTSSTNASVGEVHYFDRLTLIQSGDVGTPFTYSDFTARSGVDYEYRVRAIGANGAVQYGSWVS